MNRDAIALVIDAGQLVAQSDPSTALGLLVDSSGIPQGHLQSAALAVMAFAFSGEGASARFAELRADIHEVASQHASDDRHVVASLETIAAAEALASGDPVRADEIVSGSAVTAFEGAWNAVSLTGQAARTWIGDTPEIWNGLRRHFGVTR